MTLTNDQIRAKLEQARRDYVDDVFATLDEIEDAGEKLAAAQSAATIRFGRDREQMAMIAPFGPDSLTGSFFRYTHEEDDEVEEGMVVGQPHTTPTTAFYLCEFFGKEGTLGYQQVVDLERMVVQKWTFYDSETWLSSGGQPVNKEPKDAKALAREKKRKEAGR